MSSTFVGTQKFSIQIVNNIYELLTISEGYLNDGTVEWWTDTNWR